MEQPSFSQRSLEAPSISRLPGTALLLHPCAREDSSFLFSPAAAGMFGCNPSQPSRPRLTFGKLRKSRCRGQPLLRLRSPSSHGDDSPRSDCYAFICLEGEAGRMLLRKTFFSSLSCWKNLVCWKCGKTWDWHLLLHLPWGHSGNERCFQLRFFCSSRFKAKRF